MLGCSPDGATSGDPSAAADAPPAPEGSGTTSTSLSVADFESLVSQDGVQVIDVRTPDEYATSHLADATNIDVQADFAAGIADLDKTATYALYCRSGVRSVTARQAMLDAGFTHVVDLSGGILAWTQDGRPVVTG